MTGTIVIINGASSSGKTSIIRSLQDAFDPPYLEMGLDRFIFMLPRRYLRPPLWQAVLGESIRAGAVGLTLVAGMHEAIAAAARAGNNILADHVLVERQWVLDCARLFAALPAYLIGVQCPLEILEDRERQRTDRTLGQARAQFALVHRYANYDLQVDTSLFDPGECARQIIDRLNDPPLVFRTLNPE